MISGNLAEAMSTLTETSTIKSFRQGSSSNQELPVKIASGNAKMAYSYST